MPTNYTITIKPRTIKKNRLPIIKEQKLWVLACILFVLSGCKKVIKETATSENQSSTFTTPLGKEFRLPEPSKKLLDQYESAKKNYYSNPEDVNAAIWYGRRTAYLGRYEDAIAIYSEGIKKFPKDPRLYRHRGHRYISVRAFDKAIADLKKASELIQGTENKMEPDGIPNALNTPISTTHGNIWYHLGLAYYLKHEYEKAFDAYQKCRETSANNDNLVSSTHWLYMIQRRLGNSRSASAQLESIVKDAEIIENHSYYTLCKFYKGLIPIDSLQTVKIGSPSSDAIIYGLANWHFYNNEKDTSKELLESLVKSTSWSSFGYIAAESDLLYYFDATSE